MSPLDWLALERFIDRHARTFARITRKTNNEIAVEDVQSEARLLAADMAERQGDPLDFDKAAFADRFFSWLYQRVVHYQDKKIRAAVRLDHAPPGSVFDRHPLAERLAASGGDPVALLMAAEALQDDRKLVERAHSLAAAYVRLARHFRNDVRALADYLLISRSWAYRRLRRVREAAEVQASIPFAPSRRKLPLPRPWRGARVERRPQQLALDFGDELLLIP